MGINKHDANGGLEKWLHITLAFWFSALNTGTQGHFLVSLLKDEMMERTEYLFCLSQGHLKPAEQLTSDMWESPTKIGELDPELTVDTSEPSQDQKKHSPDPPIHELNKWLLIVLSQWVVGYLAIVSSHKTISLQSLMITASVWGIGVLVFLTLSRLQIQGF